MLLLVHKKETSIAPEADVMMAGALNRKMNVALKMGVDTGSDDVEKHCCVYLSRAAVLENHVWIQKRPAQMAPAFQCMRTPAQMAVILVGVLKNGVTAGHV